MSIPICVKKPGIARTTSIALTCAPWAFLSGLRETGSSRKKAISALCVFRATPSALHMLLPSGGPSGPERNAKDNLLAGTMQGLLYYKAVHR